jgi:adenylate cyclase
MEISSTSVHHGKILIVDDEKANVLLLEQMLRSAGYDAISSTLNSAKVCELHLLNHYDLILLDLKMPGMDGFQVMENLKTIETGVYLPVLVITAQPDHKLRALKAGAKDFISKPFDLAELLIRVYNMLEVRLLHMEALRLYDRVVAGQKVSEKLMLMMQPPPDAEPLHGRPEAMADGSGALITESNVEVLMGVLQNIFTRLDNLDGNSAHERSKALGEAYLAAVGLSDTVAELMIHTAITALDMMEALGRFNAYTHYKLKLHIGINTARTATGRRLASLVDAGRTPTRILHGHAPYEGSNSGG